MLEKAVGLLAMIEGFKIAAPFCTEDTEKRWMADLMERTEEIFSTEFDGQPGVMFENRNGEHVPETSSGHALDRLLALVVMARIADGDLGKRLRELVAAEVEGEVGDGR